MVRAERGMEGVQGERRGNKRREPKQTQEEEERYKKGGGKKGSLTAWAGSNMGRFNHYRSA